MPIGSLISASIYTDGGKWIVLPFNGDKVSLFCSNVSFLLSILNYISEKYGIPGFMNFLLITLICFEAWEWNFLARSCFLQQYT